MGIPSISFNNNALPVDWADDPATPKPTTTAGSGANSSATRTAPKSAVTFSTSYTDIPENQKIGPLSPSIAKIPQGDNNGEHVRIFEEMKKLASRNAWSAVEQRFQEIKALKSNNIPTSEEFWLGAQAARDRGDFSAWAERLQHATATETAVEDAMKELKSGSGYVNITVPKNYILVRSGSIPFAPDQVANINYVIAQIEKSQKFSGLLVAGDYILKPKDTDNADGFKFTVSSITANESTDYKDKALTITFTEQKKARSPAEKKDPIPPSFDAIVGGKGSYTAIENEYKGNAPKSRLSGWQAGFFVLFSGNIPLNRGDFHVSFKPGIEGSANYLGAGDDGNQELHLGSLELMPQLGLSVGNEAWQVGASGMFGGAFNTLLGNSTVFIGSSHVHMNPDTAIQTPIMGGEIFFGYKRFYSSLSFTTTTLGLEQNKNGAPYATNRWGAQIGWKF